MYWLITAYDVLDTIHLTARCIGDAEDDGRPLEPLFHRSTQVHLPRHLNGWADTLKWLAEELNDLAYAEYPGTSEEHR